MAISAPRTLKPRKRPVQARSTITVDAIYAAAIQVLLAEGAKRTTTIRVAERAGVSVGTLYQYHANIQSLMASVIQRHLADVTNTVGSACQASHNKPMKIMLQAYIDAFVDAKTANVNVSRALYSVSAELNCAELLQQASARTTKVVQSMLATATDCKIKDLKMAAKIIVAAQMGPIRFLLEAGASPKMVDEIKKQLFLLCTGYVKQLVEGQAK
jgi:AcrR family transcriptional regulator